MKTKTNIFLTGILLLAAAFGSCDRIEETPEPADGSVRFNADIGKQASAAPQSRASGSSWAEDDAIGIFMVANGTDRVAEAAANREHTTPDGTGSFIPAAGQNIYYPMDDSAVDFVAYYPYAQGLAIDGVLPVITAGAQTDGTQAAGDLLWAKADNKGAGYRKSAAGKVNLRFTHRLTKITFRCRLDASVGSVDPDAIVVVLKGLNTAADFRVKDGTVGNPSTPADITPRRLNPAVPDIDAVFDAIVIPAQYSAGAVTAEFWIAGERFICDDIAPVTFQPGKNHVYNVLVTRTGVKATGIIENWEDQTMPPIIADWSGDGSSEDTPLHIYDERGLAAIADAPAKHYRLMKDIDVSDWIPLCGEDNPFTGSFDGMGHTVTIHSVQTRKYMGLFGALKAARIRRVCVAGKIEDNFSKIRAVGGIAGSIGDGCVIENCLVTANFAVAGTELYVGGIYGQDADRETTSIVRNCLVRGNISNYSGSGMGGGIGGVAGRAYARIINCVVLSPKLITFNSDEFFFPVRISHSEKNRNNYAASNIDRGEVWKDHIWTFDRDGRDGEDCEPIPGEGWWTQPGNWRVAEESAAWDFETIWRFDPDKGPCLRLIKP